MKDAKGLVEYVKTKVGNPYLYGFKQNYQWNNKCTKDDYNQLKKMYGSLIWKSDEFCVGKYPCDCSGLISAYTGVQRGSSNFKLTATKTLPISKITKAQPGCLLWKDGHIGVLVSVGNKSDGSDSYYIAEDGSAYGCQKKPVNWNKWTHILWCCDLIYDKKEEKPVLKALKTVKNTVKKSTATSSKVKLPYKVKTTVSGVMVRKSPNTSSKTQIVDRLKKGKEVTIVAERTVNGKKYGQLKKSKNWIRLKNTKKI